jgi:hypothetical protein
MGKDDVWVINAGLEQRTAKSGRQRYTIAVKSEPVIVNLDPKKLGQPIAQAIAHHFREKVAGIAVQAAANTIRARKTAAKAYAEGKAWALKRYSGGRTGPMAPNQSDRAFNDSTRFEKTIVATAGNDGRWRVNVAANRLADATSGGAERVWARLVQLVPEFGNPALLLEDDIIRKSIEKATKGMLTKAQMTTGKLQVQLIRSIIGLVEQGADLIAG